MRFFRYGLLAVLPTIFSVGLVVAQQASITAKISGQVTDNKDKRLAGVVVEVQEANRKTITGADGTFTIDAAAGDVLTFSKKGYTDISKTIIDATFLQISLEPSKMGTGENNAIVIPFGTRTKRELNDAVSTLDATELPQVPTSNVLNLLAGRIPGLYVQQTNTTPGNEGTTLQIRGRSTYNGGNSPRILVDGVFRDATELDVREIESVTVLKDAAALTWYGLNAANGVVMINTRKGSAKSLSVNFTTQAGQQLRGQMITPLNSFDYATLYNEALTNTGQAPLYNQAALDAYRSNSDPFLFPDNNYINRFMESSAPVQRHVVSADGGSSSFRYFTLLSYLRQDGMFTPSKTDDFNSNAKFQRINFRVNLDFDVNKNLGIALYAGARTGNMREPLDGGFGLLNDLYNLPPNAFPILNQDGSYGGTSVYRSNPLGRLQDRGYIRNLNRSLFVNVSARQKINFIKGLSAHVLFSYDATGNYTSGLSKDYEVVDRTGSTPVTYRTQAPLNYIGASFNNSNRRNEIWAGFDYDRAWGGIHTIKASVRGQRAVDAAVERLDYRGQQVASRIDYALMDRYFLGIVGTYAGSENFPPGKRYGFFPAVSAGWILSEENFIKNFVRDNYIKLRASYGTLGNGDIGGPRLPYRTLYRAPAAFGYPFGTSFGATVSADLSAAGNPNITWEELQRANVGVDLVLLNRAFSFSLDYFKDERSGILTSPRLPSILGYTLQGVNEGAVSSKGWESAFSYHKQLGNFDMGFNANYTYAKNNVESVNEDPGMPGYQSAIGRNTGTVGGTKRFYISQGIFQNQAEIDAAPKQSLAGRTVPGDIRYQDVNGDGEINSLDAVNTDYTEIPHTYYGFGLNIQYKNFALSGQFQGVQGRTIQVKSIVNSGPSNLNALSMDRWTPATAATAKYPRLAVSDRGNNDANSDFWLRSGDFLKLRTVELSYSLGEKVFRRLKMTDARFFLSGYNLLTFTDLDLDVDPELPYAGYGSAYPNYKTVSLGLHIRF